MRTPKSSSRRSRAGSVPKRSSGGTHGIVIGSLLAMLTVSVAASAVTRSGVSIAAAVQGGGASANAYSSYYEMMSSVSEHQQMEQARSTSAMQELYSHMISSMMNQNQSQGMNASYMQYMQQVMSSAIRWSSSSSSFNASAYASSLQQMMPSQSSVTSFDYSSYFNNLHSSAGTTSSSGNFSTSSSSPSSVSSSAFSSTTTSPSSVSTSPSSSSAMSSSTMTSPSSSSVSTSASASSQGMTSSDYERYMQMMSSMMASSSSSSAWTSYEAYASSMQASLASQPVGLDSSRMNDVQEALTQMTQPQAVLTTRLTEELTLTPVIATEIHAYVTDDLPNTPLNYNQASQVFQDFKVANGLALMVQGRTTNPDVDPHDWYAPAVAYVEHIGLMRGQDSGLFEPAKTMNQAELAKVLASAVDTDATPSTRAPIVPQAFRAWPSWAGDSIVALGSHDIDLSFFVASPDTSVTRGQMARAITSTFFATDKVNTVKAHYFADTAKLPPTMQNYIKTMSALGIMNGTGDGTSFEPYGFLNRAQAAKIFSKAMDVKAAMVAAHQ